MGQSSSIPSQPTQRSNSQPWRRSHISVSARDSSSLPAETDYDPRTLPTLNGPVPASRQSQPLATFSRQVSSRSTPVDSSITSPSHNVSTRNEVLLEEYERRQLSPREGVRAENTPVTYITASPMPRRSRLSNLRGRLFSRHGNQRPIEDDAQVGGGPFWHRSSSGAGSRQAAQGLRVHTHRRHLSSLAMSRIANSAPGSRSATVPVSLHGSTTFARRRPASMASHGSREEQASVSSTSRRARHITYAQSNPADSLFARFHRRRLPPNSRIDLAHQTESSANTWVLNPLDANANRDASFEHPPRVRSTDNTTRPDRIVPTTFSTHGSQSQPRVLSDDRESPDDTSWIRRLNVVGSSSRRHDSRAPSRSSRSHIRLAQRNDDLAWSIILSIAAGSVAAQVSGSSLDSPVPMQALRPHSHDATLHLVSHLLQHAEHRGHRGRENSSMDTASSVDSMRIFRLVSRSAGSSSLGSTPVGGRSSPPESAVPVQGDYEDRNITIVLVALRTPSTANIRAEAVNERSSLSRAHSRDSLLELPTSAPPSIQAGDNAGHQPREIERRSRLTLLRRASFGGVRRDSHDMSSDATIQRHRRSFSTAITNRRNMGARPRSYTLSEPSPGPAPPPSTPAEFAISAASSHTTAPARAASAGSASTPSVAFAEPSPDRASFHDDNPSIETHPLRPVRQRRQSDSDFARHRNLGAGAARRNGVVEPDDVHSMTPPANRSRNWLVYVVGTDLSQDRSMWSAPGLYNDVSLVSGLMSTLYII